MHSTTKKILQIIKKKGFASTADIASELNSSRAYAHRLIQELRQEGVVTQVGKTNKSRYVLVSDKTALANAKKEITHIFLRLKNKNIAEDQVFRRIEQETGIFLDVKENIRDIVNYAFTEMLNNAIDHSKSPQIEVDIRRTETAITFVIRDFGVGAFNSVCNTFHLPGTLAAIQEILKGKTTTDSVHHSGQGIFFTSKIADIFIIDSFEKKLTVNNLLPDIFISDRKVLKGTRVSFSIHLHSTRKAKEIFDAFTNTDDDYSFNKTRITIKLFQLGRILPSRSEAKRVTMNLHNFTEVELDFSGVDSIGQAFADQIFRVWHTAHPDIRLIPINANENVAFMIQRAGGVVG